MAALWLLASGLAVLAPVGPADTAEALCPTGTLNAWELNTAFWGPGLGATASQQGFGGGDYARTFRLPDGRVLWLFQDLHFSNDNDLLNDWPGDAATGISTNAAHNAGLLQQGPCWTILGSRGRDFIGDAQTIDSRVWFWALDGAIGSDGALWIFMARMENPNGTGASHGAVPTGTWVARLDPATLQQLSFGPAPDPSLDLFGWSVTSTDQWSYLYGHCYRQFVHQEDGVAQFDASCMPHTYVARVPRGRFDLVPEYWNGTTWTSNRASMVPVMTRGHANPMSVQWFGDRFVSVTKQDDWWGTVIYVDVAARPEGPFQQAQPPIWIVGDRRCDNCGLYGAMLLPWLDGQGNMVVSISNGSPYELWRQNAYLYRPSFYTVPLPAAPGGPTVVTPAAFVAGPANSGFVAVDPERLVDTRQPGQPFGRFAAGSLATLDVSALAPPGATAMVMNLTATRTERNGWVRAFPCDRPEPATSNLNQVAGSVVTNAAVVPIGDGLLCFRSDSATDLLVDLNGWIGTSSTAGLIPASQRLMDTRSGLGGYARLPAGIEVALAVGGPAGTVAVALNVTAVRPATDSYITAWPCGTTRPVVSNLNPRAGVTRPNIVNVRVGAQGSVCLYTQGETDLLVDLTARYVTGAGAKYVPVHPQRLLDTRADGHRFWIDGHSSVVPLGSVVAAQVNLTATRPTGAGFVTAYRCLDSALPTTSNVNYRWGETTANAALLPQSGGYGCAYQAVPTHLVVDIFGVWR